MKTHHVEHFTTFFQKEEMQEDGLRAKNHGIFAEPMNATL
jgi:hypothetical protein